MDPETPHGAKPDPRAHRARLILLVVAAALIISPFVVYLLLEKGAGPRP
jgi:hypothetical protein